jgi:hypothetical protein
VPRTRQLALRFFFKASGSERPADLEWAVTGALEAHRWRAAFASTSSSVVPTASLLFFFLFFNDELRRARRSQGGGCEVGP